MKKSSIKQYLSILPGAALMLMMFSACGPREIPDKKMKAIIHDVFMVNAYQNLYNAGSLNTDSVDFYQPILKSYGYDLEDFRYTIDRWSLKKSARLSELIDNATADIQKEHELYLFRQQLSDRVDALIIDRYRDTVYQRLDSLWVRKARDKDTLTFTVPMPQGNYRIRYRYRFDSPDDGAYANMRYYQKNDRGMNVHAGSRSLMRGGTNRWIDLSFKSEALADSLQVWLADPGTTVRNFSVRIDSLTVTFNEPIETARIRFIQEMIQLMTGKKYPYELPYPPKDSGALHVVPPRRPDTEGDTDL